MSKGQSTQTAGFIESMECLPVIKLPEGPEWTYEIKLDGYRLEAVRTGGETALFSQRANLLNKKFGYVAKGPPLPTGRDHPGRGTGRHGTRW